MPIDHSIRIKGPHGTPRNPTDVPPPNIELFRRMIDNWDTFCHRWSDRLCLSCGIVTAIAAIVGLTNVIWLGDGFVPCAFINTRLLDWEVRNCSLVKAIDISASRLRWPTWNDSIDLFEVDCSDVDKVLAARWSQLIAAVAENYNIRETGCNTSTSPAPGSAVVVHIDPSIVHEHGICRTEETACSISKMFDENARKSGLRKVVAVIDPSPCTSFDCEGFAAARLALNIIAGIFGAASCLLTASIAGLCLLDHIHDRRAQPQLEPARSMDARIKGEPRGERRREQQHDVSNASPRCVRCNAADTRTLACEQCGAVQLLALRAQSFSFVPANAGDDDDDDDDDADDRAEDDATGTCVVCLERFTGGDQCVNLPCLHRYHSDCIAAWLSQVDSCPICKRTILESLREAELLASPAPPAPAPVPAPKSKRKRRARRNRHRLHVSQAVH
jgi:hypothetical protein